MKQSKSSVAPRLRFQEFGKALGWETTPLGEVFHRITNGKANAQDHEEGGAYPLFDRSETIKSSHSFIFDAEVIVLPGEGVAFKPRHFEGKFNLHQRAYALMNCQGHGRFFYYALDHSKERLAHKAVKSTVLSLRLPIIENFEVFAPQPAEQQKIADCLTSLDEVISAQRRRVEALKTYKRGMMQQLFPRKGETIPCLRFPEYRDATEWTVEPLSDVADNLDSKRVPITEGERTRGDVPYYGASGVVDHVKDFLFNEDLLCVSEDGANLVARTYPIAFSITGKTWVNNHAHVLRFKDSATQKMVEAYLNATDLRDFITGMAQPKLNRAMLDTIPVPLPTPEERVKIAEGLSSLDTLVARDSDKLDALRSHKKGLMQQLFPAREEAL